QVSISARQERCTKRLRDPFGVQPVGTRCKLVNGPPHGLQGILGDAPAGDVGESRVDVPKTLKHLLHEAASGGSCVSLGVTVVSENTIRHRACLDSSLRI